MKAILQPEDTAVFADGPARDTRVGHNVCTFGMSNALTVNTARLYEAEDDPLSVGTVILETETG